MKVLLFVFVASLALCWAAPGAGGEDDKLELFSGVVIEKDANGEQKLNVKFEPGELRDAARTFEEARGKVKKYTPLIAGIGFKVIAVLGVVFGALTLLVTKALVVAKLAFFAVAALGLQKYLGSGLYGLIGNTKQHISSYQPASPLWSSPSSSASASYPYARSSIVQDSNDLAYKSQIAS